MSLPRFTARCFLVFATWQASRIPGAAQNRPGRGSGELQADVVQFEGGDRLTGTWVEGFGESSAISWLSVHGETPALYRGDRLAAIMLKPRPGPAVQGPTGWVELAGGDRVPANLAGLTADKAAIETWFSGRLEVDRRAVARVVPGGRSQQVVYEGPGTGEGWVQSAAGADAPFAFRQGVMLAQNNGMASLPVEYPELYQIEMEALSPSGRSLLQVGLHIARPNEQGDGLWFEFRSGMVRLSRRTRGAVQYLGNFQRAQIMTAQPSQIHIMVDRKAGRVMLALNGDVTQTWTVDAGLLNPRNRHVVMMINNAAGFEMSAFKVSHWDGRPPDAKTAPEVGDRDLLRFANQDTLSGTLGAIQDGKATFETAFARMEIPVDRIDSILLAGQKAAPALPAGARVVRVGFRGRGELHVDLRRMDGENLTVRHPAIGEFQIPLAAVERLDFNLEAPWRQEEAAAAAAAVPVVDPALGGIRIMRQ